MARGVKATPAADALLVEMFAAGQSNDAISAALGLATRSISRSLTRLRRAGALDDEACRRADDQRRRRGGRPIGNPVDDVRIVKGFVDGKTDEEIGEEIGRTRRAISMRIAALRRLGYMNDPACQRATKLRAGRGGRPMGDPPIDVRLIELFCEGLTNAEIAAALNRTKGTISRRLTTLRRDGRLNTEVCWAAQRLRNLRAGGRPNAMHMIIVPARSRDPEGWPYGVTFTEYRMKR